MFRPLLFVDVIDPAEIAGAVGIVGLLERQQNPELPAISGLHQRLDVAKPAFLAELAADPVPFLRVDVEIASAGRQELLLGQPQHLGHARVGELE